MVDWFMRRRVISSGLLVMLAFFPLALLVDRRDLLDMMSALTISTAGGVIFVYWPGVRALLNKRNSDISDNKDFLLLGIMVICFATFGNRAFSWWWRWYGQGNIEWFDTLFPLFLSWLFFVGYMLHLSAPRTFSEGVPRIDMKRIGVILAIGVSMGLVFCHFN